MSADLPLKVWPWSPSPQPSRFSLTLDLDDADGDQGTTSLDLQPNQSLSIRIFGTEAQGAGGVLARFGLTDFVGGFGALCGDGDWLTLGLVRTDVLVLYDLFSLSMDLDALEKDQNL